MRAPTFCLPDQNNNKVCLKDFEGKHVILYFYPRDNTPGCTIEAIDFTKLKKEFEKLNAIIIGVSKDSCESHIKFIDKQKLNLLLLSDVDHKVMEKYDVWQEKSMYGKKFLGVVRSTFLINPQGELIKEWRKVKARGHAQEVLDYLKAMFD